MTVLCAIPGVVHIQNPENHKKLEFWRPGAKVYSLDIMLKHSAIDVSRVVRSKNDFFFDIGQVFLEIQSLEDR